MVHPGLWTDAIVAGRKTSTAICEVIDWIRLIIDPSPGTCRFEQDNVDVSTSEHYGVHANVWDNRDVIDIARVSLEYFDPRITELEDTDKCGSQCASCGSCRDCGICVSMCPQGAISREDKGGVNYE